MSRAPLRRLWLRIHRWIGLTLGPLLALTALFGAVLVVALPIDRHFHSEFFVARSPVDASTAPLPLEPLRERLLASFGPDTTFTLRPPHQPDETVWVLVRAKNWEGTLYLDPVTGAEQGRRGTYEGPYNLLYKLHSAILLDTTGRGLLACVALSYLFMLVTGLVLWWPARWPPTLRIVLNRGLLRGLFDLHRTGGAVLGLLIALSVATGAYMAWRPLGGYISAALGQEVVKAPAVPKGEPTGPRLSLDEIVARGQQVFPGQPIGYVQVPAKPNRPVRLRFRLDDDPHPNGISSVWLHPLTGEVLAVRRWRELDTGNGMVAVVYPLHTGELGGPLHQVLVAFTGLSLAGLGFSGIWLWWRRRTVAAAARNNALSSRMTS
jgi:uncharacterized iron-regulated membrane protein